MDLLITKIAQLSYMSHKKVHDLKRTNYKFYQPSLSSQNLIDDSLI